MINNYPNNSSDQDNHTNIALKPLTTRQLKVLDFIRTEITKHGCPPTMREIGDRFDIRSTNGVRCLLQTLERKGAIKRKPYSSRGIELTERPQEPRKMTRVPIVGRVAAGEPLLAEQNIEGEIYLDHDLFPAGDGFALRVKGDSMIEAGINDGDIVIARPDLPIYDGSIVVALIEDEATVKRIFSDSDSVRLEPANPAFKPIIVRKSNSNLRIVGRVVGLYRRY